jgi:hypothetical protein
MAPNAEVTQKDHLWMGTNWPGHIAFAIDSGPLFLLKDPKLNCGQF